MKKSIPVIVDEMNIMYQLHRVNIAGISWPAFFRALSSFTGEKVKRYFACANVRKEEEEHYNKRKSYFATLSERGVTILEGFVVRDSRKKHIEKGVDVLVGLQIYKEALQGAKDIIVCSADSDLVPAILDAQRLGARVHVVMSDFAPGKEIIEVADKVISLEEIIQLMAKDPDAVRYQNQDKKNSKANSFKKHRKGMVCA